MRVLSVLAGGLLGIAALLLTSQSASATIIPTNALGAQVTGVFPGSPAHRAGMEIGDIIIAVNGRPVRSPREYLTRMAATPIANLIVRNVRNGQYNVLTVAPVNGKLGIRYLIVPVPADVISIQQPIFMTNPLRANLP